MYVCKLSYIHISYSSCVCHRILITDTAIVKLCIYVLYNDTYYLCRIEYLFSNRQPRLHNIEIVIILRNHPHKITDNYVLQTKSKNCKFAYLRNWKMFNLAVFILLSVLVSIVFVLLFVQRFMKLRQTRKQRNPFYQASDDCPPSPTNNDPRILGFALRHVVCVRSLAQLMPGVTRPGANNPPTPAPTLSVTFITSPPLIALRSPAASLSRSHQSQILMTVRVRWATALNLC